MVFGGTVLFCRTAYYWKGNIFWKRNRPGDSFQGSSDCPHLVSKLCLFAKADFVILDGTGRGGEVDAHKHDGAGIGKVGLVITFCMELLQGFRAGTVLLELHDVDVVWAFHHAVDVTLGGLFLNIVGIAAHHLQYQIEGGMEMALALKGHTLAQQTVGDGGEERLHAEDEGFGLTLPEQTGDNGTEISGRKR